VRVAALYDVHGNIHALEAVLGEAADADVVLFGGDLASGPFPRETIDRARELSNAEFVLGNADLLSKPLPRPEWDAARRWVEQQLDEEQVAWLERLPFSWTADDTLYVHANPVDVDAIVTERTPDERVRELLREVRERRVVTGHIHIQFERDVDGTRWIGAGSVGMPYADRPGAYWAIVTPDAVEFRRTEYDLEAGAAAIRDSGYPGAAELAAENVLACPTADEALAVFSP
jgi:diadenosine tetraphosphatase ApaH/serine/threonine PP2A family protein phosphatase